ncbi:hypothetical protein HOLleu_13062 [Holothuria leucospilota]|uniref:Uncharacterized protein n=1 Tax=Holothuria leucospilota TaxID=206669 RepID=A0A9Q1CCC4_HOLLE|nr:hypothetical protein HOLleu_13062 [Holothuria leucospilota]
MSQKLAVDDNLKHPPSKSEDTVPKSGTNDTTRTNLIEHDVDVGDATPIKQHPYRVNPRKRQHLRDEVRYMLDHDIIEPSNSEWSSPCILVPKPDVIRSWNQFLRYSTLQVYYCTIVNVHALPALGPDQANIN